MSRIIKKENDFLNEAYYKIEHDSGLTIYVMPKSNLKSAYAVFGTNYGSVDTCFSLKGEKAVCVPEGIAHFLEHKLFESEELDAFERYAKTGAYANAYTSFDKTCYLFSCSDNLEKNLEILLDFVKHPYFTEQTVQKEQGIIGQEIQMYRDSPDWQVLFNLLRGLYEKNPVRIDIAGTKESISDITAELLYSCYGTFYNNSNMVLAVAGNVTKEQVLSVCDRLLEKEEKKEIVRIAPPEENEITAFTVTEKMETEIPKFAIGFREQVQENDTLLYSIGISLALELICGKTTSFYAEMLNEGLINSLFSVEYFQGRGFAVNLFSGESNMPERVKERLLERIGFIKANGVDEQEFEALRRKKYGDEVKCFNDVEALGTGLVNMHFEKYELFDIFDVYRSITKQYVEKLISEAFNEKMCVISIIN